MIEVNMRDVKQYESDLKTFAKKAFPFATKATVNKAAFETRKVAQMRVEKDMTLRNKFTKGSIRVEQARTLNVRRQEAIVGSIAEYLATQEFGGVVRGGGKHKPIATAYSAGQGEGVRPRTRLPRKPNSMQAIQLKRRGRGAKSRKQRNLMAVKEAAAGGSKYVYLDLGRRQGIFKVLGGKRSPRVKMLWDLSRTVVRVPRSPWLAPATRAVETQLPQYYAEALAFQLQRRGILGR
ncbi:hypothetical protein K0U83_23370 [bacterium]|nr:hypothetical protein [bacterium]